MSLDNTLRDGARRRCGLVLAFVIVCALGAHAGPGTLFQTYNDPANATSDAFGTAVAPVGGEIVVGAPNASTAGRAFRFTTASPTSIGTIAPPAAMAPQNFGGAIGAAGSQMLIGDRDAIVLTASPETSYRGAAVFFSSPTDVAPVVIPNPIENQVHGFGAAVAAGNDIQFVGAPEYSADPFSRTGRVYVYGDPNGTLLDIIENPVPATESRFGAAMAYSPADNWMAIGAPGFGGATSGAVHQFSDSALIRTIGNPAGLNGDLFGFSVANVGTHLIVGAPGAAGGAASGAVHVFDRLTGAFERTITNPASANGAEFGYSVAGEGTDHVIVGAPDNLGGQGAAYVFSASSGVLLLTLDNPSPLSTDDFGKVVASLGADVLVGDPTGNANISGQVFLFGGPDSPVATPAAPTGLIANPISSTQILITFTDNSTNESGFIAERRLADGGTFEVITTLPANESSYNDFGLTANTGYCYRVKAFNADGESAYSNEACATTPGNPPDFVNELPSPDGVGEMFGFSLTKIGNIDIANYCVAIGAPGNNTNATSAGATYIFDYKSTAPIATMANPSPDAGDQFGYSVGALPNKYVIVGAPFDDTDGPDAGMAYLFDANTAVLVATYHNPSPTPGSAFGRAVSNIGGRKVLIGAPGDSTAATSSGVAYLFDAFSGELIQSYQNPFPNDNDQFGGAVGNAKGKAGIIAPYDDLGGTDQGTLYEFNGKGIVKVTKSFAHTIGSAGGKVIIGAPQDLTSPTLDSGMAYWLGGDTLKLSYSNPSPNAGDAFGFSVSGVKKHVVIGAPRDDTSGTDAGIAYLYKPNSLVVLGTYPNPSPLPGDQFGYASAVVGNYAYISAPFDDARGTDAGTVIVYKAPGN